MYNDNKKLLKVINKKVKKESDCTQEAGAVMSAIKWEIESACVAIKIEYANDRPRPNELFEQQQGSALMKMCDKEAKKKCIALIDGDDICNIKHIGIVHFIVKDRLVDKNINVLIREIDAKRCELLSVKERVKEG